MRTTIGLVLATIAALTYMGYVVVMQLSFIKISGIPMISGHTLAVLCVLVLTPLIYSLIKDING